MGYQLQTMHQYTVFYNQRFLLVLDIIFIHGIFFSQAIFYRTFPDVLKFQDISRTWKMNLLFSRMCGNWFTEPKNIHFHHQSISTLHLQVTIITMLNVVGFINKKLYFTKVKTDTFINYVNDLDYH